MSIYVGFKIGKAKERKAYISEYYCGRCGFPVSDHDSYCPECGGAFRKKDATERTCKNVSKYSNFFICSECGCEFDFLTDNDARNGGKPNYCYNCGAKVVE